MIVCFCSFIKLLLEVTKHIFFHRILNEAAYCIEDHTAYSCIVEDKKMFKETMTKLMQVIKDFSLKQLEKQKSK